MTVRKKIKDLLHFNRGERGGMVVLLVLLAGTIGANLVIPLWDRGQTYDFTEFEQAVREFEARRVSDSLARAQKHREETEKGSRRKRTSNKGAVRHVGENRMEETGSYGASQKNAGYSNRSAGMSERVAPSARKPDSSHASRTSLTLELNTADSLDLQQLHGIGPAFSRRIVKYRQLLGGYARVEQLLEVYGMDSSRYDLIAGHLTVDTTLLHKIDLSTATIKELMRHPYIEFYVAKLLVSCRESCGPQTTFGELEEKSGIPPALLQRIMPYLAL